MKSISIQQSMQKKVKKSTIREQFLSTRKTTDKQQKTKKKINKSKQLSSQKRKKILVIFILLLLVILPFVYIYYDSNKKMQNMGINVSPLAVIRYILGSDQSKPQVDEPSKLTTQPELKKDSTKTYTNILITGIDTRSDNAGLQNTDTVIVVSYNYDTQNVVMISIPRDLYVKPSWSEHHYTRINSIYRLGNNHSNAENSGLEELKRIVEKTLGIEIQYYALIDYTGFVELVDIVGGLEVPVKNSFTDYKYPSGHGQYETVSFQKGEQLMNGDTALKYARSRKSMNAGEGSDFARAERQQKIISALKEKLLSSETLLKPQKLWSILNSLEDNVTLSQISDNDVQAAIGMSKKIKTENNDSEIFSFVLSPSSANGKILTDQSRQISGYSIVPVDGLGKNDKIQEFIKDIIEKPKLYSTNPSIYIYNGGIGYREGYNVTQTLRTSFPYLNLRYMGNLDFEIEGVIIYSNQLDEKDNDVLSSTVDLFSDELNVSNTEQPSEVTGELYKEDITIILGKEPSENNETPKENDITESKKN